MTEEQPNLGNDGTSAQNHDEPETSVDPPIHEQASNRTESTKDVTIGSKDGVEEDDDGETGEEEDEDGEEDEDEQAQLQPTIHVTYVYYSCIAETKTDATCSQ